MWALRWGALGAVAAVLAIPVTIVAGLWDGNASDDRAAVSSTDRAPSAHIEVQQYPENAIFPVSVGDLPTPPDFVPDPEDQQESHCLEWEAWLKSHRAAMLSNPALAISAPAQAAATVTAVRVVVFRSERPRETVFVPCHEGAGGYEPTYLQLDLRRPHQRPVLFEDARGGELGPIPDAVFTVPAGRTETLALTPTDPRAGRGTFYEWGVELTVIVDRVRRTVELGTAETPFRTWLGDLRGPTVEYEMPRRQWTTTPGS